MEDLTFSTLSGRLEVRSPSTAARCCEEQRRAEKHSEGPLNATGGVTEGARSRGYKDTSAHLHGIGLAHMPPGPRRG